MHVKICGIRPGDNLDFSKDSRISHIGFVFEKRSSRYVSPDEAANLVVQLDPSCDAVGVFRNRDATSIAEICKMANIKIVQLHGNETPEACRTLRRLGYTVWKTVSISVTCENPEHILNEASRYARDVDTILLDSSVRKNEHQVVEGGFGISFSWRLLGGEDGLISRLKPMKAWIAGGIKPENASLLLDICDPFGIDISSGVEIEGRKSKDRISELIKVVSSSGANDNDSR